MGILIASLAVLLSSVIGAVAVSAENAVSCCEPRSDIILTVVKRPFFFSTDKCFLQTV